MWCVRAFENDPVTLFNLFTKIPKRFFKKIRPTFQQISYKNYTHNSYIDTFQNTVKLAWKTKERPLQAKDHIFHPKTT